MFCRMYRNFISKFSLPFITMLAEGTSWRDTIIFATGDIKLTRLKITDPTGRSFSEQ